MYKIPDTITEEELIKILKVTKKKEHKTAFLLGFYECMRISEVTKLQKDNIDLGRHTIHIKQAKNHKDRIIPINPMVVRGLKYIPLSCGIRALQIAIKRYGKKAIGKDIHFHTLRHSGATYYLGKQNWNLRQIQTFLGHSRIDTTQIYTHINPQELIAKFW